MAPPNEPAAVGVVRFSSLHDVPASFVEANGATDPLAPRPGTLSRLHKSLSTFSSSTSLLPHSSSCTFQEPTGTRNVDRGHILRAGPLLKTAGQACPEAVCMLLACRTHRPWGQTCSA